MKRLKVLCAVFTSVMMALAVSFAVQACGENLTWELYADGTLSIYGKGDMYNYGAYEVLNPARDNNGNFIMGNGIKKAPWSYDGDIITKVVVEEGVTSIGDAAFLQLKNLSKVKLPQSLEIIGAMAFFDCENLEEVEIPDGVKIIGTGAFMHCDKLTAVTIPKSVESIGIEVCGKCDSLVSIKVEEGNVKYQSFDGVLFSEDKTILNEYPDAKDGEYIVPDGVKRIEAKAFNNAEKLIKITIPESVREIGKNAFAHCDALETVDYCASKDSWVKILSDGGNSDLDNATKNYNVVYENSSDIENIQTDENNEIVLTIGERRAMVFGEEKISDAEPKIVNNRTMLPARFVAENLGAEVIWTAEEPNKITIEKDNTQIILYVGSEEAFVNEKSVKLDSPAFIENKRTYTPVRFIVESLGAWAEWNSETRQVIIIVE